jgi:hypothetical protein
VLWAGVALLIPSVARAQPEVQVTGASPAVAATPAPVAPEPAAPVPEPAAPAPEPPAPRQVPRAMSPLMPDEPPEPRDQELRVPFGSQGQWVLLGSSNGLGISNQTFSGSSARFFDVGGELGLDRFVARNVSIGLDLAARHSVRRGYVAAGLEETHSTLLSGGVRFGFNLPLPSFFSWYPRLTVGLASWQSDTVPVPGSGSVSASSESSFGPFVNLFAPFLVQPVPHFVVGFGPRLNQSLAPLRGGPREGAVTTVIGADFVLGGFWGGPGPERPALPPPATPSERAFGAPRAVVLTLATEGSLWWQILSQSKGWKSEITLVPSFDYFVSPNLSFGLSALLTHGEAQQFAGAGAHSSYRRIGLAPRVGVNLALGSLFSLWPQAELGFGVTNSRQTVGYVIYQSSRQLWWVTGSLPVLAHVASHFFVGAGPSVSRDLTNTDPHGRENRATTVGASFVLGGWL